MEILLEHPDHGRMHVYSEAEAERVAKWGWVKAEAPKPEPARHQAEENAATVSEPEPAAPDASPASSPAKRRGRPPKGA